MKESKTVDISRSDVHKLRSISVAFNEDEFLLIFNENNTEQEGKYLLSIPAEVMAEIVNGFYSSGVEYQKNFNKDIGFFEKEE